MPDEHQFDLFTTEGQTMLLSGLSDLVLIFLSFSYLGTHSRSFKVEWKGKS